MLNVRCNPTKNSTKIITTLKMDKEFKNCQSCGMPLKRDEKGGGTNADKSISKKYCSYCYENGEFVYKGNNVSEFQEYCQKKMMEGGHSRFFSWLFIRGMKRLDRWKAQK